MDLLHKCGANKIMKFYFSSLFWAWMWQFVPLFRRTVLFVNLYLLSSLPITRFSGLLVSVVVHRSMRLTSILYNLCHVGQFIHIDGRSRCPTALTLRQNTFSSHEKSEIKSSLKNCSWRGQYMSGALVALTESLKLVFGTYRWPFGKFDHVIHFRRLAAAVFPNVVFVVRALWCNRRASSYQISCLSQDARMMETGCIRLHRRPEHSLAIRSMHTHTSHWPLRILEIDQTIWFRLIFIFCYSDGKIEVAVLCAPNRCEDIWKCTEKFYLVPLPWIADFRHNVRMSR